MDAKNQIITRNSIVELSQIHAESKSWLHARLDENKTSMQDLLSQHHLEIGQHFQSQSAQLDRIEVGLRCLIIKPAEDQPHKTSSLRSFAWRLLWMRRVTAAFYDRKYRHYDRLKILSWLSNIPYQQHHKQSIDEVQQGTGLWFLLDNVYRKWRDSRKRSFLWLHGAPGTGKSKLS